MNSRHAFILGLMVCGGCASAVPRELTDARAAYQRASSGPAARENPAQLHVAEQALSVAEKTFDDEGDSHKARDRAYVAIRKAELAEVQADIVILAKQAGDAEKRNQLAMRNQLGSAKEQLAAQREELDSERKARVDADRRAADTRAALERIASVRADSRGVIVSLPGGVLFASGKSELLGAAKNKLSEVAVVLAKDPNAQLTVEGYTDSRGSDQLNNELSAKRAEAVRSFLVSKGIPAENVVAAGHGKDQPIADNATAEGRANNRRVEIVVKAGERATDGAGTTGKAVNGAAPQR